MEYGSKIYESEYTFKRVTEGLFYTTEESTKHESRNVALGEAEANDLSTEHINKIYDTIYFSENLNPYMVISSYVYYLQKNKTKSESAMQKAVDRILEKIPQTAVNKLPRNQLVARIKNDIVRYHLIIESVLEK